MDIAPYLLMQIAEETSQDPVLSKLKEAVASGWPDEKDKVHQNLRAYFTFQHDITYSDNVLFKNSQIIIPAKLQSEILQILHEFHQGIMKTKQLGRERCNVCNVVVTRVP